MGPETKRTFIAIDLDESIRSRFAEVQDHLRAVRADMRWVRPEQAHLTLKFLGDATADQIEVMASALDAIAADATPFEIGFAGLGVFPNERRPRVLWIGLGEGTAHVRPVAAAIDQAAEAVGFERERRPFSGHITLGRFKSDSGWERLRDRMHEQVGFDAGRMTVGAVHLIESVLSPQGPQYTTLHTAPFGRGA